MILFLNKFKKILSVFFLILMFPYFSIADGGPSGNGGPCSKKDSNSGSCGCPNFNYRPATLYLKFDNANYSGRICTLPAPNSDPSLVDGSIMAGASNTYWARIFVEPICSQTGYTKEYWIRQNPDRSWPIEIPDGIPARVTVQFREARSNCSGFDGLPYFEYVTNTTGYESTINAYLLYVTTYL